MKKVLLAAGLGLGIISFTMAGASNTTTAPLGQMIQDTLPQDTTDPAPDPDTTSIIR